MMVDATRAIRFEEQISVQAAAQFLGVSPSLVYVDARRLNEFEEYLGLLGTAIAANQGHVANAAAAPDDSEDDQRNAETRSPSQNNHPIPRQRSSRSPGQRFNQQLGGGGSPPSLLLSDA